MSEMVDRVAAALRKLPIRDSANRGSELDNLRLREAARAAIIAMRELPEEPGPRYFAGEYSRRNQEAMVDDALFSARRMAKDGG